MRSAKFLAIIVVLAFVAVLAFTVPDTEASAAVREPIGNPYTKSATPVYLANGSVLSNAHEVVGRVTATSPVQVTLTGLARFSNPSTYFCTATGSDDSQTLGPQVVNVDGAHFRIVHAYAEAATVTYRCIGM